MNVGIVGAGIFGASTALEFARRGHRVTAFDRQVPPANDAASSDRTKALRFEYGAECPLYVPLVAEARDRYRALEKGWAKPLYVETGVLALSRVFDETRHEWWSYNYLVEHDWPIERWDPDEAQRRFPQFDWRGMAAASWNEAGGYVRAAEAVRATVAAAREAGAVVVAPARVTSIDERANAATVVLDGERFDFDAVVVCSGPWLSQLVVTDPPIVRPTRQFVTYYRPPSDAVARFTPPAFCVWMYDIVEAGWYGMPLDDGVLKVAHHEPAESADPDAARVVLEKDREDSRAFVRAGVPAIDAAWYAEDLGCLYAMTADGHFVVDRLPGRARTYAAGGGSGHGFKLGPAVGRLAADLVESGQPPVSSFRFDAVREGRVS